MNTYSVKEHTSHRHHTIRDRFAALNQIIRAKMKTRGGATLFIIGIIIINVTIVTTSERADLTYTNQYVSQPENEISVRMGIKALLDTFHQQSLNDISRTYQYYPNIVAPPTVDYPPDSTQITLCTQASENHLHLVSELAAMWKGPLSVSVFTTPDKLAHVIYTLARMRMCNSHVREYVHFHLACAIVYPTVKIEDIPWFDLRCNAPVNDKLLNENTQNYNHAYIYPNNILRTISMNYAQTVYVTSLDIDVVPTKNLNEMMQVFLKEHDISLSPDDSKVAYVLPCFEFGSESFTPMTKEQLLKLWPKHVRPFHIDFCPKCHENSNYTKWVALPQSDKMAAAYTVSWAKVWEPFYIARKAGLPVFDGQFKNYGYNRRSQVCELYVAGYEFKVLNNGFVVHRGIKRKTDRREKSSEENARNAELFKNTFLVEVKSRYPKSQRSCL